MFTPHDKLNHVNFVKCNHRFPHPKKTYHRCQQSSCSRFICVEFPQHPLPFHKTVVAHLYSFMLKFQTSNHNSYEIKLYSSFTMDAVNAKDFPSQSVFCCAV